MNDSLVYTLLLFISSISLLPLKDKRSRQRGFPWTTAILVIINVLIFLWVVIFFRQVDEETAFLSLYPYMEVPKLILAGQGLGALSSLTSGFLHAGWDHLLGNMFVLWFFGRKVEDATGSVRFVLLYLLCLFTSSFLDSTAHLFLPPASAERPGLGASGAISGIMAAYLFLYSEERVLTLVRVLFCLFPYPIWLPAWIYIVHGFLFDALLGQLIQEGVVSSNLGVFAHMGGAAGGLLFIYFFLHPDVFAQRR